MCVHNNHPDLPLLDGTIWRGHQSKVTKVKSEVIAHLTKNASHFATPNTQQLAVSWTTVAFFSYALTGTNSLSKLACGTVVPFEQADDGQWHLG